MTIGIINALFYYTFLLILFSFGDNKGVLDTIEHAPVKDNTGYGFKLDPGGRFPAEAVITAIYLTYICGFYDRHCHYYINEEKLELDRVFFKKTSSEPIIFYAPDANDHRRAGEPLPGNVIFD